MLDVSTYYSYETRIFFSDFAPDFASQKLHWISVNA